MWLLGAVLCQIQGGLGVVAFAGGNLASTESNCCVTRKELLSTPCLKKVAHYI